MKKTTCKVTATIGAAETTAQTTDLQSFSAHFETMVEETRSLLRKAVDAYIDSDLEEAKKAIDGDHAVNIGEWAIFKETGRHFD